jgi:lipopolysaccharide assembly outer membrane protein LptD (OstA)
VSLPLRLFNVMKVEPHLAGRETYYRPRNDPTHRFDDPEAREMYEVGIDVGAELYRVYERTRFPWLSDLFQVRKWMHTIEPNISYQYISPVDQTRLRGLNGLPLFDEVDQIPFTSQITYGITQRFVGKPVKEGVDAGPREYAKLILFQSYSFGDPLTTDRKGKGRDFSDIQGELWWYFNPFVTAQVDAAYNTYEGNLTGQNASVILKDRRNDALSIGYRYTRHTVQALNLYSRIKMVDPLYVYGSYLYNYQYDTRVESTYGLEYQSQCWSLGVNVDDIAASPDGTQKREFRFQVYLNLLGVGSLGRRSSNLTF